MHKCALVVFVVGVASIATASPAKQVKLTVGTAKLGTPGALDGKAVVAVAKRATTKLRACYIKVAGTEEAPPSGTSNVTFTVGADGAVTEASAMGLDAAIDRCVADAVRTLRFGKPKGGASVEVTLPLAFAMPAATFATLTGTGDLSGSLGKDALENDTGEISRGFGMRGTGVGRSTGMGTIGVGSYGTIGRGGGQGSGFGVGGGRGGMRGRLAKPPSTLTGNPTVDGDLDKAIIRRTIRRHIPKIRYCYEKALLAEPTLQGTSKAEFTIGIDGKVVSSSASGFTTDVDGCIAGVISAIVFPKPRATAGSTGQVTVSFPFTFRPSDEAPATTK